MHYTYPVEVKEAADGVTVVFPDVPEAITEGATLGEALERASDALVTALSFYVDEDQPLPRPSPPRGRPVIAVPALEATKLALHDAMLAAGLSNVELGRALGLDEKAVRRLRDLLHHSHVGALETALLALGKQIEVNVRPAPAEVLYRRRA